MSRRPVAGVALTLALALLTASACASKTLLEPSTSPTTSLLPSVSTPASPSPASEADSAEALIARQCPPPDLPNPHQGPSGATPPEIRAVEREVERSRGLDFEHPVATDAVSPGQMKGDLASQLNDPQGRKYLNDQGKVLETMGAIPEGTDLSSAVKDFATSQVAGYYDPATKELVFLGGREPTTMDMLILAHELTHALDDQHFDLTKLLTPEMRCHDEAGSAVRGLAEGSAMVFGTRAVESSLTPAQLAQLQKQVGKMAGKSQVPESVPDFVTGMEEWPYFAGMQFVGYLESRGGVDAVNEAFAHPPTTTEQVIHPSKYPDELPRRIDVPNLGPKLGQRWRDLAAAEVGEAWLDVYLALHLDKGKADSASAGWDGGLFRTWTDGDAAAVLLSTAWDIEKDAQEFETAMHEWLAETNVEAEVVRNGDTVQVIYGSTPDALQALAEAAALTG